MPPSTLVLTGVCTAHLDLAQRGDARFHRARQPNRQRADGGVLCSSPAGMPERPLLPVGGGCSEAGERLAAGRQRGATAQFASEHDAGGVRPAGVPRPPAWGWARHQRHGKDDPATTAGNLSHRLNTLTAGRTKTRARAMSDCSMTPGLVLRGHVICRSSAGPAVRQSEVMFPGSTFRPFSATLMGCRVWLQLSAQ